MTAKLRLAAVGDCSALAPIARVARVLESRTCNPSAVIVTIEPCSTPGTPLASVQRQILDGAIEAALCSGQRLPLEVPADLEIGAVLRCRDPRYQFVSLEFPDLALMPPGSKIVVCDSVARAQIRHRFSALHVETTPPSDAIIAGLRHRVWDAACVSAEVIESDPSIAPHASPIPADELIPAVGQGLCVLLLPAAGSGLRDSVRLLNDPALEHCFRVERVFLARLANVPTSAASARATQSGGMLDLTGMLADENGRWLALDQARAPARFGEVVALEVADGCRGIAEGRATRRVVPR